MRRPSSCTRPAATPSTRKRPLRGSTSANWRESSRPSSAVSPQVTVTRQRPPGIAPFPSTMRPTIVPDSIRTVSPSAFASPGRISPQRQPVRAYPASSASRVNWKARGGSRRTSNVPSSLVSATTSSQSSGTPCSSTRSEFASHPWRRSATPSTRPAVGQQDAASQASRCSAGRSRSGIPLPARPPHLSRWPCARSSVGRATRGRRSMHGMGWTVRAPAGRSTAVPLHRRPRAMLPRRRRPHRSGRARAPPSSARPKGPPQPSSVAPVASTSRRTARAVRAAAGRVDPNSPSSPPPARPGGSARRSRFSPRCNRTRTVPCASPSRSAISTGV